MCVEQTHVCPLEAGVGALDGTREDGKPHVVVLKDPAWLGVQVFVAS